MIIFVLSAFGLLCAICVAAYYGYKKGYTKGQTDLLGQLSTQTPPAAPLAKEFEHLVDEYFPRN